MIMDQEKNFNLKKLCCYGLIVMDCKWLTQLYYFNPNNETIELFGSVILIPYFCYIYQYDGFATNTVTKS